MIFCLLFLYKDAKKPLHFATRYGYIYFVPYYAEVVPLAKARGQKVNSVSPSPETAQRPSASVIEAADAMREVAGNVA